MSNPYEKDPKEGTLLERLDRAVALATKLREQAEDLMVPQCDCFCHKAPPHTVMHCVPCC